MRVLRICSLGVWVIVPVIALQYRNVWDRLPNALVTRFDPESLNHTVASVSRGRSLWSAMLTSVIVALISSVVPSLWVRRQSANFDAWFCLACQYFIAGLFIWSQSRFLAYQVAPYPVDSRGDLNSATTLGMPAIVLLLSCFLHLGVADVEIAELV